MDKVILTGMKRFEQEPGCCAFGAVAAVANYLHRAIDYDLVCRVKRPDGEGLYTPDIGTLLNTVGFKKVKIISADLSQLDFKWADLSKKKLIEQMKEYRRKHPDQEGRDVARQYVKFLEGEEDNQLTIDMHFGQHIRESLIAGTPVLASFNWNLFFSFPKWNEFGDADPIKGDFEQHEIVIYGFDDKGVNILDSHHEMYKGKLKKYRSGRYKMDWETLMTVMGFGDLIIPSGFDVERANELVSKHKES